MIYRKRDDVVILSVARSPVGKFMGALKDWSAPELAAPVIGQVIKSCSLNPAEINRIIIGNVLSAGLGQNAAKQAVLKSGLEAWVMTHSVNRLCASSLHALKEAFYYAKCENEMVIAMGMESMSQSPYIARRDSVTTQKMGHTNLTGGLFLTDSMLYDGLEDAYSQKHMGELAAMLADEHPNDLSRPKQDLFALNSHRKAIAAKKIAKKYGLHALGIAEGYPIEFDEGVRDTSMDKLSGLKPIFGNTVTAGNASQLSDGAAAVLVSNHGMSKLLGLNPVARIAAFGESSNHPNYYTTAPVFAVQRALAKAELEISDIDLIEINEAFAVVPLYFAMAFKIDLRKINVWGGAIALGHPIGASGARIVVNLVKALQFKNKHYGLAVACHGGGGAVAVIIENLQR